MRIGLTDASGHPATGAVSIEANMSHPGMQPVFADARPNGAGAYQASLNFGMAGDWTIVVHAALSDGARIEKEFPFTVTDR